MYLQQLLTILVIISSYVIDCEVVKYHGYRVYRTNIDRENVDHLRSIERNGNYSIWASSSGPINYVDVMMSPEHEEAYLSKFPDTKLFIEDVQKLIDGERPRMQTKSAYRVMSWDDYHTYDEINDWLKELVVEFSGVVSLISVGKSYENRDILGVHVSYSPENKNKGVVLEGGMHAREWIGVATVTYLLNELLRSKDVAIRQIAESHDWYIFPIFNPDGYSYTFTTNRMWRKTRKPHGLCRGADPNRNWAYKWQPTNYNFVYSCSETYAGPGPFSEPETKALSEYFKTIGSNLIGYISHHSYSQVILLPYGDSSEKRDNFEELYSVGKRIAEDIKKVNGTEFDVGNIVDIMYKATGNNVDWIKYNFKTRMTFIYELRDKGQYGFMLPADQIIPSGKEIMVGLITMFAEFQKIDENVSV